MTHNAAQLRDAIEGVRAQLGKVPPELARASFASEVVWQAGVQVQASMRQFRLQIDEPPQLGGADAGPNPVEILLAALGGCQEIVYAVHAALLGIPLDAVRVRVEGTLDPRGLLDMAEVPAGLLAVKAVVEIDSPAAPEEIARLSALVERSCPVLDSLRRPVATASEVILNGQVLAAAD